MACRLPITILYESGMKEREPGFFTGLYASDFMGIGIAFLFSLGGLYLAFRLLFGPPLYDAAIEAQIKAVNKLEASEAPVPVQPDIHTGPGEVSVGIMPSKNLPPPPSRAREPAPPPAR